MSGQESDDAQISDGQEGPEQPTPEAASEQQQSEQTSDAVEPSADTATQDDSDEQKRITQQVINFFHGDVSLGESGAIGFAVGEKVNRETGPVLDADVTRLRAHYFRTKMHREAEVQLKREHLLLLVGPEGSGRAAAALTLAACIRDRTGVDKPLVRIPPTRTLEELSKQTYRAGRAYVVNDWVHGKVGRGVQAEYEIKRLAQILLETDAYLVMTAVRGSQDGEGTHDYEVEWSTPDPVKLFDHCIESLGEDAAEFQADLPALRSRASQLPSARRVVDLVRRLRLRGVEEALADDEERDRRSVEDWFNENPSRRALRAAVVLALACRAGDEGEDQPGVTQRGFETLFAALEASESAFRQDPPSEAGAPPEDEKFPQVRHGLLEYAKLTHLTVQRPTWASIGTEHRPGFKTARLRALFLSELHLRCGDELWSPLRICLADMVKSPSVGRDVLHALACGIGRTARYETQRVREEYLDLWASSSLMGRECAVYALWTMAAEDDLAPIALNLVGGWIRNRGEERAITAALTLGGPLGKRYPSEAMWLLWELALRGVRISIYARLAIARLLQIEAQGQQISLANGLVGRIQPMMSRHADRTVRRAALRVIADVLDVPGAEEDVPGVVDVLRQCPDAARPLGELWAAVLLSAPHRDSGVRTLRRALNAFESSTDGVELAAQLGAEILPRLTPGHRRQVELGLYAAEEIKSKRAVLVTVRAFLGAMTASSTPDGGMAELSRK